MTDLVADAAGDGKGRDDADAARIVKSLTKAQRDTVLKCQDEWLTAREIGANGSTLSSLCSPPLTPDLLMLSSLLNRDYMDSPLRYIYRLSPLGLAVRAALLEQPV